VSTEIQAHVSGLLNSEETSRRSDSVTSNHMGCNNGTLSGVMIDAKPTDDLHSDTETRSASSPPHQSASDEW